MSGNFAIYLLGRGIPKDEKAAAAWFQQAADLSNPAAMFDLGWLYETASAFPCLEGTNF